ncbi:FadR family transcriptional regulator [Ancylobacter sp. Lp-2]|uniref:FadR/GntR family transcriptional regulator n=1 Tax=Ancylobacter sp. Lp-2 TaxID=2881339 RepID=UPI001E31E3A3|nr:FadR/GntR family transcriptional regulator [Ancylobacter sp. Lp-2]MCB4768116.1 FadR family transcriptional regulator [Ancylobacter sp. Lp-2]
MTLYRSTLARLGKDICAGIYPPGQVIPAEPVLCARLGVSRIVVREAIKGLASKGMVEARRRTGTVVLDQSRWSLLDPEVMIWRAEATGIDRALANDIMELRRIVEPAAARLAAERASAVELAALRAAFDAMAGAVASQPDYVAADLAFHDVIIRACANPFVSQLQSVMSTVLRIGFERVAATPGGPERSLPLHRTVCEAIEQRRGLEAEAAILALLDLAENDLRQILDAEGSMSAEPPAAARKRAAPSSRRQAGTNNDKNKSRKETHDDAVPS